MAKIFKKYRQHSYLEHLKNSYTEASLLDETDAVRSTLLIEPDILTPENKAEKEHLENYKEIDEESFYYNRTTPSSERCSSSPYTEPEECRKSISPMSTDSCTSEYYQQPIIDDILKQRKRLTKDEKVARDEGIDKFISVDQIINMELKDLKDELMRQMTVSGMNQHQYDSSMLIRKRGKNKSAAQNCRKKKQSEIASLGDQVSEKTQEIEENLARKETMVRIRDEWAKNLDRLCALVLQQQDMDPKTWKVVVEDNEVRFKPAIKEPVVLRNETALPHLLSVQHLERISNYNRDRGLLY